MRRNPASAARLSVIAIGLLGLATACNETRGASSEAENAEPAAAEPAAEQAPPNVKSAKAPSLGKATVSVEQPWVWATPNPKLAAAYFELKNSGAEPTRLLSVSGDVADRLELHESVEQKGVVRMVPHPDGFEIPSGETLTLERGGKHVMLIGLKEPLAAGKTVELELSLSNGQVLPVKFPVRQATESGAEE